MRVSSAVACAADLLPRARCRTRHTQIARDWNTKEAPFAGRVVRFEVPDAYARQFDVQVVGSASRRELWVRAEDLVEFNAMIVAPIVAERAFFGRRHRASASPSLTLEAASRDVAAAVASHVREVFRSFPWWKVAPDRSGPFGDDERDACIARIRQAWAGLPGGPSLIE